MTNSREGAFCIKAMFPPVTASSTLKFNDVQMQEIPAIISDSSHKTTVLNKMVYLVAGISQDYRSTISPTKNISPHPKQNILIRSHKINITNTTTSYHNVAMWT
jgi:hypothetical protein